MDITKIPKPLPIAKIQPTIHFYGEGIDIEYTSSQIEKEWKTIISKVRSSKKVIFLVHGFMGSKDSPWLHKAKDALRSVDCNATVAIVGWGKGATLFDVKVYVQTAANALKVGGWLGEFAQKIPPDVKVWGVGHSLGAHLLGEAGRSANELPKTRFERITGLDPAGPAFEDANPEKMLSQKSATFVDVIHTDGYWTGANISPINHYGTLSPLGDIDFYPNFGLEQPGCNMTISGSHNRVVDLYIWSIRNKGEFVTDQKLQSAPACDAPTKDIKEKQPKAEMGYYADKAIGREGNYYLGTNRKEPWAPKTS